MKKNIIITFLGRLINSISDKNVHLDKKYELIPLYLYK